MAVRGRRGPVEANCLYLLLLLGRSLVPALLSSAMDPLRAQFLARLIGDACVGDSVHPVELSAKSMDVVRVGSGLPGAGQG